jgi:hypothetical protein
MKLSNSVLLLSVLLGSANVWAQQQPKVGAPNNANNNQPGQTVHEGSNQLTFKVETGDVVMLEKGDPNHPENWDKTDKNWSDVIRFYNTDANGVALMISDGENGIREASLPAVGSLPAGQLANDVEYILESATANPTDDYSATGSASSTASYSFFSDPSDETGQEDPADKIPDNGATLFLLGFSTALLPQFRRFLETKREPS